MISSGVSFGGNTAIHRVKYLMPREAAPARGLRQQGQERIPRRIIVVVILVVLWKIYFAPSFLAQWYFTLSLSALGISHTHLAQQHLSIFLVFLMLCCLATSL